MNETSTFDKGFRKSFGWFLLIALAICCLPWIFAKNSWWIDFTDTGQIGDTIGGIMGPFVAIAAAGLTFIAFWVQYKANIQQRHDIAIERFENNLFEMIHIQQEITNGLKVSGLSINNETVSSAGRDVFQCIYEIIKVRTEIENATSFLSLRRAFEISDETKCSMGNLKELWGLDHYYRHLYRIIKYIDEQNKELVSKNRKYNYVAIVRATLSPYELVMLFYNGFSHPRFKELIEEYALLNNLRYKLLATTVDRTIYSEKFKDSYKYSEDENRDMTLEYKKSAFVYRGKE